MFSDHPSNIYAILLFLPVVLLGMFYIAKSKFVLTATLFLAVLKIFLIILNCYYLQFYNFSDDVINLNFRARDWAAMPLMNMLSELPNATGRYFFAYLLAILYRSVGEAYLFVLFANVFLTALIAACTYDVTKAMLGNERVARFAFVIVATLPMYFIYSLIPSREALVGAGFAVALRAFVYWMKDGHSARIPFVVGGLMLCAAIHSAMVLALLLMIALMVRESWRRNKDASSQMKKRRFSSLLVLVLLSAIAMPPLIFSGWALKKFGGSMAGISTSDVFEKYAEREDGEARTGYIREGDVGEFGSVTGAAKQIPVRLVYFMSKPWPWDIGSPIDFLSVYINIFLAIPLLVIVFRRSTFGRYPGAPQIALCIFLLSVVFAFGTSSWGTGVRHKTKFFPALVLLTCVHHVERKNRRQLRRDARALRFNQAIEVNQ